MKRILKSDEYYLTSDLAIATALSLQYPLDSIDKSNPQKAKFIFRREDGLDDFVEKYWRRQLKVEPQSFFNQLRNLKSRLYEEG